MAGGAGRAGAGMRYGYEISVVHHYRLEFDVPDGMDLSDFLELEENADLLDCPDFEEPMSDWPTGWRLVDGDIVSDGPERVTA